MRIRKSVKVTIVILAVVGLIILFAQDPSTVRLDSAVAVEEARFLHYASAVTGV